MKKLTLMVIALGLVTAGFAAAGAQKPLAGKRVLMLIPEEKFRDEELVDTGRMLSGAGAELVIASSVKGEKR